MKLFIFSTLAFLAALFLFDHYRTSPRLCIPFISYRASPHHLRGEGLNLLISHESLPLPSFDRIHELFKPDSPLPFVETLIYKPKVSKGAQPG